jgi:mono/diheme cytochrome c family protein
MGLPHLLLKNQSPGNVSRVTAAILLKGRHFPRSAARPNQQRNGGRVPNPEFGKENAIMKTTKVTILVLAIAVALFALVPSLSWAAEDGAAIYKAKCAACHAPDGAGKIGPALKGTKLTDAQISDLLTKGADGKKAPHAKAIAGVSADQAKAVGEFVKSLK